MCLVTVRKERAESERKEFACARVCGSLGLGGLIWGYPHGTSVGPFFQPIAPSYLRHHLGT